MTPQSAPALLDKTSLQRALRNAALGFAISAAVIAGAQQLGAQAIGAHNSDAPVNFGADHIELQDKQKRVVLTGNVDIVQDELHLTAARTTLAYTDAAKLTLNRIDAAGGVVVTRANERASGDVAVYDFDRRIITMAGNVALRRGKDTLNGGRLVIDLTTGQSSVDGRSGGGSAAGGVSSTASGRVTGTFSVPKKTN
ncbi:LptA/OstA family protein [Novosphingobium sp. FKTRR1]|uniref:LptA/OstA family protein n=1 Tax=Novosphingobium sp. FKTRR1 TaxID=2879118 RepID=UPI001CF03A7F|nr:LptA/OstA family protein [Novosphingobium sp. FKTRR1]